MTTGTFYRIGLLFGIALASCQPALAAGVGHGTTWEDAVRMRAQQHGLVADINHDARIVGIAETLDMAKALSAYRPTAWKLEAKHTLKDNLAHWSRQAGWNLRWEVDMNYLIDQPVVLIGPFVGDNGVIAQVMGAYRDAKVPLRAVFHNRNHFLEILPYQR